MEGFSFHWVQKWPFSYPVAGFRTPLGTAACRPLGADSSAYNAFRAKICPSKAFKLRILSAPSLCRIQSCQSATRKQRAPRNGGGSTTDTLPKVGVTSTAAWDGWGRAHPGALAGTSRCLCPYVAIIVSFASASTIICSLKGYPGSMRQLIKGFIESISLSINRDLRGFSS